MTIRTYSSPDAFKQALEQRLRAVATVQSAKLEHGMRVSSLKVNIERKHQVLVQVGPSKFTTGAAPSHKSAARRVYLSQATCTFAVPMNSDSN